MIRQFHMKRKMVLRALTQAEIITLAKEGDTEARAIVFNGLWAKCFTDTQRIALLKKLVAMEVL